MKLIVLIFLLSAPSIFANEKSSSKIINEIESQIRFGQSSEEISVILKKIGIEAKLSPVAQAPIIEVDPNQIEGVGILPVEKLPAKKNQPKPDHGVKNEPPKFDVGTLMEKKIQYALLVNHPLGITLFFDKEKKLVGYEKYLRITKENVGLSILEVQQ